MLWDVLESCKRSSALDKDIDKKSAKASDVPGLLLKYASLASNMRTNTIDPLIT